MTRADLVQYPFIRAIRERIIRTPRPWKRVVMILMDAVLLLVVIWASYALHLSNGSPAITPARVTLAFLAVAVAIPIFIYGAGPTAAQLARALRRHGNRYFMRLIDGNPTNHGHDVGGYRVFPPRDLPKLVERSGIREIVLSMSSIPAEARQAVIAWVSGLGIKIRSVPDISDIVDGRYIVNQIREIEIDEPLVRCFVPPDRELLARALNGKTVMVIGAGGSIGSELCRLIATWKPAKLVLLEASEFALYRIEQELATKGGPEIVPVLGSVADEQLVRRTIRAHRIEVLYHAAAHKHVPLVEANVLEGIRNSVSGTLKLAQTAAAENVRSFVLISSDKAVRPANVMGATKRWAELIVRKLALQARSSGSDPTFCAVRFGNFIGYNGSVMPLFKEQITKGGVTDPDMTRYFMSIPETAELIVQAGAMSEGGDVFLLDMGEPVRVGDLAENMIRLAGFKVRNAEKPDGGIAVKGRKAPRLKAFEELIYNRDHAKPTAHPKIMRADASTMGQQTVNEALVSLKQAVEREDEREAKSVLFDMIMNEETNGPRSSTFAVTMPF